MHLFQCANSLFCFIWKTSIIYILIPLQRTFKITFFQLHTLYLSLHCYSQPFQHKEPGKTHCEWYHFFSNFRHLINMVRNYVCTSVHVKTHLPLQIQAASICLQLDIKAMLPTSTGHTLSHSIRKRIIDFLLLHHKIYKTSSR